MLAASPATQNVSCSLWSLQDQKEQLAELAVPYGAQNAIKNSWRVRRLNVRVPKADWLLLSPSHNLRTWQPLVVVACPPCSGVAVEPGSAPSRSRARRVSAGAPSIW